MRALSLTPLTALAVLAACQPPPGEACESVRFAWPPLDFSAGDDEDPESEGLQLSFDLPTDLPEGATGTLLLAVGEEPQTFVQEVETDADGVLRFERVTIPFGDVIFFVEAQDDCSRYRSGRRAFIWDGQGRPSCSLAFDNAAGPDANGEFSVSWDNDLDSAREGFQLAAVVDAGRPDMQVNVFSVSREDGQRATLNPSLDQSGGAIVTLDLSPGTHALRSSCYWPAQDFLSSSPSFVVSVPPEP